MHRRRRAGACIGYPLSNRSAFLLASLLPVLAACASTAPRISHSAAGHPPGCASAVAPVDEKGFVAIGGIEQWVTVKGDSCANPVVLFISGGPGNPLSPYSDAVYGSWAKDFTLVQWDQRGAGMTYGRNPPAAGEALTIERMSEDGIELASYLVHRFGKQKVILWGSSWGSILGVHMAKAHPELFHAYLGTSQLVDYRENQTRSYAKLLALVRASDDPASLTVLESVGVPPWTDPRSFGKVRRVIRKYEARVTTPPPDAWWTPAAEYATAKARADYEAGEDYSFLNFVGLKGDGMASRVDLPALGTDFAIPMFFVEGAQDLLATPDVAQRYYESLAAPQKYLVLLEHAGHDPNQDVVDAEYAILKERILPLARQSSAE
jgi:pimeloyl-ACP methyl ester carboxylesterase